MKKQKALRNSPWDMAAFCFGCAVAGFSLLFAVLLFTGSMLLFHPAASLVFAALELAVFFFLLLSKRLGISRWIRRFLLVSWFWEFWWSYVCSWCLYCCCWSE